jgi:N12 class adenine-specific DNA methylase/adenine-specific DNA methylase/GNAT superfamily N-acetyltransferase
LRKDERLRTVYETIAPHITRTEGAWRDYLGFAARFYKYSFDNALLVYAQNPNVTMLATTPIWNRFGRYIDKGATGLAVCEYDNARLTIKHLFDISQTNGREIIPTNWQLDDKIKTELTSRLSYTHNLTSSGFGECLKQLAEEAVDERLDDYLQDFDFDIEGHLFSQLPQDGLLSQIQEIVKDSVTYFSGKRCSLADDEIHAGDGMITIAHFDSIPLIARLGHTVTDISKGILVEIERTIRIIEQERRMTHEQNRDELHRERRSAASEPSNLQQQRGRQPALGQVRQNGDGIPVRKPSPAVYDFENGWHADGENAPGTRGSGGENRVHHPADAGGRTDAGNGGHHGEDPPPEQSAVGSRGNRAERDHIQGEVSPPSPNSQNAEPPEREHDSPPDGTFFMSKAQVEAAKQAGREASYINVEYTDINVEYTDEQVREYYEGILKSTDLYPLEMYEKIQELFTDNMPLEDKAVALSKIYKDYGNAEYQADVLLKTTHRGADGMSFSFGNGYTHMPWQTIAHIIEVLMDEGEYPAPIPEESPADRIGDFNIPDEIDEMPIADENTSLIAQEKDEPGERELYACVDRYLCNTQIVYKGWHGEIAAELANDNEIDEYLMADYFRDLDERETRIDDHIVTCFVEDNGVEFQIDRYDVALSWTELAKKIRILIEIGDFPVPKTVEIKKEEQPPLINVLVVEPEKKPYLTAIPSGSSALQEKVGGRITTIEIGDGIDAVCAGDADFETTPINRMINGQPIFGTFVVARVNYNTGEYESLQEADIQKYMTEFATPLVDITRLVAEYEEIEATQEDTAQDIEAMGFYPPQPGYEEDPNVRGSASFTQIEGNTRFDKIEPFVPKPVANQQMTLFDMEAIPKDREAELIEYVLLEGSLIVGGKQRVYEFAMTQPTGSAFEKMLKNEYGIGGHTVDKHGIGFENHGSKGIVFDWTDDKEEKRETKITWLRAAIVIRMLIDQGRYIGNPAPARTFRTEKPDEAEEINSHIPSNIQVQISETHLDYHSGQHDFLSEALYKGLPVGALQYSEYEGIPHISHIEVLADYRRRSVGTQLLQALQSKYPDREIEWGMTTEDGAALKEAVTLEVENEEYTELQKEYDRIAGQLSELEAEWADKAVPDEISTHWNGLHDRQQDIEETLYDEKPYKSFVQTAVPQTETESVSELVSKTRPVKTNFRYFGNYALYPNGEKTKYKNNVEAIKLLNKIESEKRLATTDEQIILARYVGWGGLANAFSDTASGWEKEYHELKHLLDEKEYADALNSVITAYYTEPELIRRIYKAFEGFGFTGGEGRKILDPAMGTGNFFSVLPESYEGTPLYGVELDSITGRIARQLYQTANIQVQGFETTRFEDNSFDIAIGNIPFNNIKLYDKRYDNEDFLIHDYFIAKSLDLVKPGGIIGFITSKGTMDKRDTAVREYIARRADLIGAIRLPNTAFKALAGTEVTADILFFQKLESQRTVDKYFLPDWVFVNSRKPDYMNMNQYFIDNTEMVLGEMQFSRNMYGREDGTACIAPEGQDLYAELDRAIGNLHAAFTAEADQPFEEIEEAGEANAGELDAAEGTKNYTYVVQDDRIYYCERNKLIQQDYIGKRADRIKGLCEIRKALLEVIRIQTHDYAPDELQQAQKTLNGVYDRFVRQCGAINDKANIAVFSDDDQFPLLRSIEDQSEDKKSWGKAPIFHKATIKSYSRPTHAETAKEALEISLNLKMKIDLSYMEKLTGKPADELINELEDRIYLNPQKYYGNYYEGWELNEEYLSGQVRDKLLYAKQKAEEYPELFERNVQALEAVQPKWLEPSDIDFRIGSPWIPIEYFQYFMHETFGTTDYLRDSITVDYMEYTTTWRVNGKTREPTSVKVNNTYGTKRVNAYQIFEDCLNLQSTTVRDPVPYVDKNGKDQVRYVVNANETMIARAKQNQIKEAFASWLFKDKDRADILLKIYNEKFNTIRPRVYDGSHLIFPGMSEEMELRPHQKNFAARVIYSGTGLAGHVVGAGKTAAMIAASMYLKNIDAIKKPVYVVPNHLTEQWAKEFYRFFPQASILVTTKKDFEAKNRNKFVSKIAMGEYDAVIIGHSQFEKIPISKERQEAQINHEINQLSYIIKKIKEEKGENWAIKQMVIFQNNLKARLERLAAEEKKDDLLNFEQLGVDTMFVDEAHAYKNCFTYTKMRNVAGIGRSASQRATDMLLKCQYLQEMGSGKGVVFATGTPISNSMSEMYVLQRYLQPQMLARLGLNYFDSWAATFGEVISSLEITPEGSGYRMRNRFAKFHNLPELMNIFQLVADIQTADMLNLPVPEIEGGKATIIATEATPFQKMIMESFVERAEKIRNREVEPPEDNMLKLTGEAKLMSIDPRLVYEDAPNDPDSKLNIAIGNVFDIWQESSEKRLTQLVFCDSGTPKPGQFNVYDEMKRCLMEKGVPDEEIAFVHDAKTDEQREALFEKVRRGEIRILLGSTSKLGTGTNVQDRLVAVHHLDCPWRPSDIEQRDGRILRQGNQNLIVRILRYVTKGTFDAYLWQIQEQKLKYISQVMTGKSISRSCEDMDETVLSAAEVKAIATSNPLLAEKMEVDNEVVRLKLLKGNWNDERLTLERNIKSHYPETIANCETKIVSIHKDMEVKEKAGGKDFSIVLGGKTCNERVKAGEQLLLLAKLNDLAAGGEPWPVGEFRGFRIYLFRNAFKQLELLVKGENTYDTPLGESALGCITRLENVIEKIPTVLLNMEQKLSDTQTQLEEAHKEVQKPFEFELRLNKYLARQAEINTRLEFKELQKQEEVIFDENAATEEVSNEEDLEAEYA